MSRGRVREQAIITSAKYNMKIIGREPVDGAACDVIELIPKRRSRIW
jgi:negative regulator of sigma E activity